MESTLFRASDGRREIMDITLMYDSIIVATTTSNSQGEKVLQLVPDVHNLVIPLDLFLHSKQEVSMQELGIWVVDRIPPRNRTSIKNILESFGLNRYDPLEVAIKTGASVMGDSWWLKTKESQTFQNFTMRGIAGLPEITLSDLT